MQTLRRPIFFLSLALIAIVVLIELGQAGVVGPLTDLLPAPGADLDARLPPELQAASGNVEGLAAVEPRGLAIRALALLDSLLLFTLVLVALGLVLPLSVVGRLQGCATLLFTLLIILLAVATILATLALVVLMVSLLLSFPFGTLAYLALYGRFPRSAAAAVLSLLMLLKLGSAGSLFLAQQRFLQNKGLVALIVTSLVANLLVGFLHGLVPRFLVSILDGIAAIVLAVIAIVWAVILLLGSLPAVLKALRPS